MHREFYYNDAGVQIQTLALSVQARARGLKPGDASWPEAAYNGDYIADIAADFLAGKTVSASDGEPVTASGNVEDIDSIRKFAVTYLRNEQDIDLQAFGVKFDRYYLESSLYSDGRVEAAVQSLVGKGKTYESEGALWLRTTDDGDDKDRVMKKSDGTYTYFVPDVPTTPPSGSAASPRSSTCRAATTTAPSRACAPACRAWTWASRRATPTTCCTRWSP